FLGLIFTVPEASFAAPIFPRGNQVNRSSCYFVEEEPETNKFLTTWPGTNEFVTKRPGTNKFVTTWPEINEFVTTRGSVADALTTDHSEPEYAPIVERNLDYYEFKLASIDGGAFDFRAYLQGKSLIVIEYFAGWCPNSNRNGHVIERLWTKYRDKGLGVVGIA